MNKVDEANDWDLQAIIRGWTRGDRPDETNTPKVVDMQPSFGNLASLDFHRQYDPVDQEANFVINNELQEVYRHLPSDSVQSSSAVIDRMKTEPQSTVATEAQPRRRKNKQPSEVMHQESKDGVLPLDEWNWRKYGQKPIKGSPYPRSYYRCSSSKGCRARKQVEQSVTCPGMYIITYLGEHNHDRPTRRYSQAGRTIKKFPSSNLTARTATFYTDPYSLQPTAQLKGKFFESREVLAKVSVQGDGN